MPRTNTAPTRRSLILDPIHPRDYREVTIIHCCEQCSHFAPDSQSCTIGYDAANHVATRQRELFERTGRVAFCRFCEID
jgi:hypothetical protein